MIDGAPPGIVAEGAGGARKRTKIPTISMELSVLTPAQALMSVQLLEVVADAHPAVSSRSVGKSSFVMPISTL